MAPSSQAGPKASIPHLLVVAALQRVAQALAVISWFAILLTGRLPAGIARFQAMYVATPFARPPTPASYVTSWSGTRAVATT
jgi:hypothetical protein